MTEQDYSDLIICAAMAGWFVIGYLCGRIDGRKK